MSIRWWATLARYCEPRATALARGRSWRWASVSMSSAAYVGIVGEGEIRDFTAIGDVVNTASRLQSVAAGGEIVMSDAVAHRVRRRG
ncbi:adenylate/guanylate cyclase domain-containing protein [Mycobacterium sp. 1245805.9]|uniref:adenylate/guanylate cyclase domain-containing protein n=1 Tax=Mycobacterium sp. 1245805.9 TaxID=1856862 RepID=UPI0035111E9F